MGTQLVQQREEIPATSLMRFLPQMPSGEILTVQVVSRLMNYFLVYTLSIQTSDDSPVRT